ncbi:MAG: N-acetylneuraminate synthase family protein [Candidatus Peregrinibacteria bacterium]|nr:N-acetylneuraminate synthase family protein [Candidatus Peregrinibacteria bacterium]
MKIVAEAGCNWSTMEEAKQFIDESKRLGLWATKFQIYNDELIKDHPDREFLKSIMIDKEIAMILFEHGREIGQEVFFTPMFEEAVNWCEQIGVNYYKIRYMDRNNKDLINFIKKTGKTYFISMNCEDNPKFGFGFEQRKVLFCQPYYPSPISEYIWNSSIIYDGMSDHTKGTLLLKLALDTENLHCFKYWEKHVCLTKDCLESKWSVTFKELEVVLK